MLRPGMLLRCPRCPGILLDMSKLAVSSSDVIRLELLLIGGV